MEIALKGGAKAVIDDVDYDLVSGYRWRKNRQGYAISHRMERGKVIPVFMHRLINGTPEGRITDHIDRNPLNNRRANLRTATKSINSFNSKTHSRNRSGYRGVSRVNRRWRSAIVVNGRQEHLGYFDTPEEASEAYEQRRTEILAAAR